MNSTHFARLAARGAAAAMACAALGACTVDDLTNVETPDVVQPGAVSSVSALPAVFASAISEFGVAFQGSSGTEGQILYSGLLSDEILLSDTFPTRREIDFRNIQNTNSNNDAVYRQLQRARTAAERAASSYVRLANNTSASQAEAYSLAGYVYTFFAENYCGGVPFSTLNEDGTITPAGANTTAQILAIASAKFDSALATATALNSAAQLNLARVGKARVLVNQGRYADAAALVAAVPTTFTYQLASSTNTTRQNNGVWSFNRSQRRFSVATNEGTNGVAFRNTRATAGDATLDPRVIVVRGNSNATINGFDNSPLYVSVKYGQQDAPAVLASGVEARLIEAEAALNANDVTTYLARLNTLRANTALYACPTNSTLANFSCPAVNQTALAALTDPGEGTARLRQLFTERAYWLYLTGHRLGDLRRLARTASTGIGGYGLGVNNVFPVGTYPAQTGVTYGPNVSLPVPFSEGANNAQFDPNSCNPNTP
jgi:hypothetical protein